MHKGKILSEKKLKQREDITGNENCIVFIEFRKFVYETWSSYTFSQDFKEQIHQQGPPVSSTSPDIVTTGDTNGGLASRRSRYTVSRSSTCSTAVRVSILPLPEASASDTRLLFAFLAFFKARAYVALLILLGGRDC